MYITDTPTAAHSRESELRLKVQSNRKKLKDDVEANNLLDALLMEGFLTEDAKNSIKTKQTRADRMQKLLEILLPKVNV